MPSVTALRAILGASLGLGAIDVVWIDAVLAPRIVDAAAPARRATPPAPAPVAVPRDAPRAAQTVPTSLVTQERVYFATGSAGLDPAARATLDWLASHPGRFALEGHADARGRDRLNRDLSSARASAVAAYLAERGVERARIIVDYVGEAEAVASDEPWRDRRVDVHLIGGPR